MTPLNSGSQIFLKACTNWRSSPWFAAHRFARMNAGPNQEDYMKTLLIALSLMTALVACDRKNPETKFTEQREEAAHEFNKDEMDVQHKLDESKSDLEKQRMEANDEYREDVDKANREIDEAAEERNKEIKEAEKDLTR
jgi:hypothetical protein